MQSEGGMKTIGKYWDWHKVPAGIEIVVGTEENRKKSKKPGEKRGRDIEKVYIETAEEKG